MSDTVRQGFLLTPHWRDGGNHGGNHGDDGIGDVEIERVFINGLPAARKSDAVACSAKIDGGSSNVFIGGGTVAYLPLADEVPEWLRTAVDWEFTLAGLVGGLAGLANAAGGMSHAR
jgi:uncharacterized Zn-binding protein involved in type VI secretion